MTLEIQTCAVCRILDGDSTTKPCSWCPPCQSWICVPDLGAWPRRIRAAAISGLGLSDGLREEMP